MRIEERFRRVDYDTLEFGMTITDPKAYTGPWSGKKELALLNSSQRVQKGLWGQRPDGTAYGDLREEYCVYSIERSFWERTAPGRRWRNCQGPEVNINGSERPSGDDCFLAVVRRLAGTLVFGLVFGAFASAQDRMPPIPADKLTPAQKKIVDEYKQARGGEPGGPWPC